jgi:hypothetical protein
VEGQSSGYVYKPVEIGYIVSANLFGKKIKIKNTERIKH